MDPYSYDAFELPKVTVLRWVSSIVLVLWMTHKWGFRNSRGTEKGKEKSFSFAAIMPSPLALPVLYFTAIFIVCSIITIDPLSSLKGTYKRQEGLFTYLNYIFIFFAALRFMREGKHIRMYMLLSIAAGTLTSLYAVLQHFGFDIFSTKGEERSFSTLNHPNFLAAYLVLVMPFAFVYMMEAYAHKNENARSTGNVKSTRLFGTVLYATCYQLMFLALLFTYCRGAWVGHVFSLAIILAFAGKETLMRCRAPLAVLLVSLAALAVLANQPTIHRGPFSLATRAASIVDTRNTTVVTRFIMWNCALKVLRSHPVLGVGLDGFKAIFPQVKPEEYVKYEGLHITADKVHNETLHMAATLGFAGAFGYFWMLAAAAVLFVRLFLFPPSAFPASYSAVRLSCLGLFASFAGYIAQNQFSFSVIVTGMVSFTVLGLIASCYRLSSAEREMPASLPLSNPEKNKGKKKKDKKIKERWPVETLNALSLPVPVLLAVLIIAVSYRPYAADHLFLKGELYGQAGYNNDQIAFYEKAVLLNPYEEQYFIKLGEAYEKKAQTDPRAIQDAAGAYKKAAELAPLNPYNFSKMGKAYVTLAKTTADANMRDKWFHEALSVLETARRLDPYNPVFFNNLAAVYNDTKQPDKSIPLLEYSLKLTPNYSLALNNMGNALVQKKRYVEAAKYFKKVYDAEKENPTAMAGMAYCAYMQRKTCVAKKWFEKLLVIAPDNKMAKKFFDVVKTQECP